MQTITPNQLIANFHYTFWKKTASTWVKKIVTQADIQAEPEAFFVDLEGRRHEVKIGRCICRGVEGERWTCSAQSLERDRFPVGDEDEYGYREYKMRNPRPVRCFDVPFPFILTLPGKTPWLCEEGAGGVVTWNGEMGNKLDMRVIKRSIFEKTYEEL